MMNNKSETAKIITDNLINRVKSLKTFRITRKVDNNWLPNGAIPFDIRASKGIATFTVVALSQQEAEDQIDNFLKKENLDE